MGIIMGRHPRADSEDKARYSRSADQLGDDVYAPAPELTQTLVVSPETQTIPLGPIPDQIYGTALVPVPYLSNLGTILSYTITGPAYVTASYPTPFTRIFGLQLTGTGKVVVTAVAQASIDYKGASVTHSFTVYASAQTITFPYTPPQTLTQAGQTLALAVTASSGLPISYYIIAGPATVAGNVLTLQGPGHVIVRASQAGNATYAPAPMVTNVITVYGGG
jgi:hypothetical protein